jgi:hypothetical protein
MLVPSSDVAASTACDREDDPRRVVVVVVVNPADLSSRQAGARLRQRGSAIHPKLSSDRAAGIIPEYPVTVIERIVAAPANRARP